MKADMSYSELGKKLRTARIEQGMTQSELCGDFLTRNMLSRIENGSASPSIPTLCYLADRLGLPAGYFLDDRDNGDTLQNRRLKQMIKEEYAAGNYALCLDYCRGLREADDELALITLVCSYHCGKEAMTDGQLRRAAEFFDRVIAVPVDAAQAFPGLKKEAEVYRRYIRAFLTQYESGQEEEALFSVLGLPDCGADLAAIARIVSLLRRTGLKNAEALAEITVFSEKQNRFFTESLLAFEEGNYFAAKARLIETVSYPLIPMLTCWAMTLLEKCCASLKDYENAYAYSVRRREMIDRLLLRQRST